MSLFEKELLKALLGIKDELRKLNNKVMKPPEPMKYSEEPEDYAPEPESSKQVSINDLNAMINK